VLLWGMGGRRRQGARGWQRTGQRERACVAGGLDLAGGCALPIRRAAPVRPSRGAGSLTGIAVRVPSAVFSILESVAFDTGYAGSNGLEPQSWVNGNGTSYIYFGSGEFDGQGSGHDFSGTLYMPPSGYVNNCDGGRSHTYCDYRQQ